MNKLEYIDWLKKVRNNQEEHSNMWYLVDEIIHESKKLEEPETLSQEYYVVLNQDHALYKFDDGTITIEKEPVDKLRFDKNFIFTKKEVENYNKRYVPFMIPVKKLDE